MWNIERDRSLFAISLYLEFLKLSKSYSVIVISFSWKWRFLTKFENFRRLKATKFWLSDENYDRQKLRPLKFSPVMYNVAHQGKGFSRQEKLKIIWAKKNWFFCHFIKNPQISFSSLPNMEMSVAFRNFYWNHSTQIKQMGNFTSNLPIFSLAPKKSVVRT